MSRIALAIGVAAAMSACGPPMTVGEACDELLGATCQRVYECLGGPTSERDACLASGRDACCIKAGICQSEVRDPAAVSKCKAAVSTVSCASWKAWVASPSTTSTPTPAICAGVAAPK